MIKPTMNIIFFAVMRPGPHAQIHTNQNITILTNKDVAKVIVGVGYALKGSRPGKLIVSDEIRKDIESKLLSVLPRSESDITEVSAEIERLGYDHHVDTMGSFLLFVARCINEDKVEDAKKLRFMRSPCKYVAKDGIILDWPWKTEDKKVRFSASSVRWPVGGAIQVSVIGTWEMLRTTGIAKLLR